MSKALKPRPLSPHLTIYKPQITSVLSIMHRASGVFLSLGIPLIVCWLLAIASGPEAYGKLQNFYSNFFITFNLFVWTAALYYHFSNGLIHLFWDMGKGFELETLRKSGIAVLATAGILTVLTWLIA